MPRALDPKQPHQLAGFVSRLIGWVKISPIADEIQAELLAHLSACLASLSKVTHVQSEEAPQSQKAPKEIAQKGRKAK